MAENYEDRQAVVLEGMYKGVAGKIDEMKQSVSKELQISAEQQTNSYESLADSFRKGVDSILAELRYLSQQNSAIYDYSKTERDNARDEAIASFGKHAEAIAAQTTDYIDQIGKALFEQLDAKMEAMRKELLKAVHDVPSYIVAEQEEEEEAPVKEKEPVRELVREEPQPAPVAREFSDEAIDYNVLAEKIVSMLPETDYDMIADKVVAAMPQTDENIFLDKVVAAIPQTDEGAIADRVAESVPLTDYDLIAEKVANVLEHEFEITVSQDGISRIASALAEEIDYDRLASSVAELVTTGEVDYERLSAQVAEQVKSQEIDYEQLSARVAELVKPEEIDYEQLSARVAELVKPEEIDYEQLSARVAELVKPEEIDYERLSARVAELVKPEEIDYEQLSVRVAEQVKPEEIDYERLATRVAEIVSTGEIDYVQLAARVAEQVKPEEIDYDQLAACVAEQVKSEDIDYEQLAVRVAELVKTEEFDYDALAARMAVFSKSEEIDYEQLAARVAKLVKQEEEEEIAEEPAPAPQPVEEVKTQEQPTEIDYERIALRVAELVKPEEVDYEQLAVRVAELVKQDEEEEIAEEPAPVPQPVEETKTQEQPTEIDYERIALRVAELVKTEEPDYEQLAARVAELAKPEPDYEQFAVRVEEILKDYAPVVAPAAEEPAPEPEEEPEDEKDDELAIAMAAVQTVPIKAKKQKPIKKAPAQPAEPELTTRLKRSFTAKMIESEEDVKEFYSELKNAFLSYSKTSSQINWTNDRITFSRETVAKIGMRGKTLCLYLALNPDEFPDTVYHQKFAGDTKMYEKTPMLVKIKSPVALKRALRLIELLMEMCGAVKEERERVDYTKMFAYRTEQQLLEEGLIKTALVTKSDLDF